MSLPRLIWLQTKFRLPERSLVDNNPRNAALTQFLSELAKVKALKRQRLATECRTDMNQAHERAATHPIERLFERVVQEFKHHTDPANHRPILVEPIRDPMKRILVTTAGFAALGLGGLGIVTPIMPTWPFVLVALFCFARSSNRVRSWLVHNRIICSVMSLLRTRTEKPFVWARQCIDWLCGAK